MKYTELVETYINSQDFRLKRDINRVQKLQGRTGSTNSYPRITVTYGNSIGLSQKKPSK